MNELVPKHKPFQEVHRCSKCNLILAWKGDSFWWTRRRILACIALWIVAIPTLVGVILLIPPNQIMQSRPSYRYCPYCGNESFSDSVAAWIPTWVWWKPWTWGRGTWVFRSDFQRLLDGKPVSGGEVSLTVLPGKGR